MEEKRDYSFREELRLHTSKLSSLFKNKWTYIGVAIFTISWSAVAFPCYYKELGRFNAGEIGKRPGLHDYSPLGLLEKWLEESRFDNPYKR